MLEQQTNLTTETTNMVRWLSKILIYQMVAFTENLESREIWKQCEGRFLKSKTVKNEINDSKDIKDIPNTSYSKTKNPATTMTGKDL